MKHWAATMWILVFEGPTDPPAILDQESMTVLSISLIILS